MLDTNVQVECNMLHRRGYSQLRPVGAYSCGTHYLLCLQHYMFLYANVVYTSFGRMSNILIYPT